MSKQLHKHFFIINKNLNSNLGTAVITRSQIWYLKADIKYGFGPSRVAKTVGANMGGSMHLQNESLGICTPGQ